jgi:hypothetical protein
MSQNRSRDDLVRFLDYTGEKGLVPPSTASARRTAATKVLAVLSDDEARDVIQVDLDDVMSRFDNLNRHQFTPDSLQTYRSRLKTALRDFQSYCENPVNFRPLGASRTKVKSATERPKQAGQLTRANPIIQTEPTVTADLPNVAVLPIPLRQNLTIRVVGLPFDLTPNEAKKIANIILAHASEG